MNTNSTLAQPYEPPSPQTERQAPASTGKVIHLKIEPQREPNGTTARTKLNQDRRHLVYRSHKLTFVKRGRTIPKWYLRFKHHSRPNPYHECLFETDYARAVTAAKIKVDAIIDGHHEIHRATLARGGVPLLSSCQELIDCYKGLQTRLGIAPATHHRNVNLISLLLREVHGEDFGKQPLSLISGKTARAWIGQRMARADAQPTERAKASKLRTLKSTFRQVSSVFRPYVLSLYRDAGLTLPDFSEFLSALNERKLKIENFYFPPPEEIIERTLHAWATLADRNAFIAAGLALSCGLRKGEISQVTWRMLTEHDGRPMLRFEGRAKAVGRGGTFVVRPIDPFWRMLMRRIRREGWRGADDERVLTGEETEIADGAFNRVSDWLRSFAWDTQKTNHALRAYSGALVIAQQRSFLAGAVWLRHASVTTTEKHYSYFVKEVTDNFNHQPKNQRGMFSRK